MHRIATILAALTLAAIGFASPASALTPTTVTFESSPSLLPRVGKTYVVDVRSDRPGPIVLSSLTPTVCRVVDNDTDRTVQYDRRGQCTLAADQAATLVYAAGHAEQSFYVY